jgi:hypothetical protein
MYKCDKCEYRLKCNIKRLKELKSANMDGQDDAPIDIAKVKQLFEDRINGRF